MKLSGEQVSAASSKTGGYLRVPAFYSDKIVECLEYINSKK